MSSYYKIEIDVSPHVKKYIVYHLSNNPCSINLDQEHEVKLDKTHHIGLYILSLLQKEFKFKKNRNRVLRYNNKKISSKINVLLAERYEKDIDPRCNKLVVNDDGIRRLDMFIDGLFRQELYNHLDNYQLIKQSQRKIKEGLLIFYKKYSLSEEDIAVETLLRDYRRYRKKSKTMEIN